MPENSLPESLPESKPESVVVATRFTAVAYSIKTKDTALQHLDAIPLPELKKRKLLLSAVRKASNNPVSGGFILIRNEPGYAEFTSKDFQWTKLGDELFGGTLLESSLSEASSRLQKAQEEDHKRLEAILAQLEEQAKEKAAQKAQREVEKNQGNLQHRVGYLLACADLVGVRYAGELTLERLSNVVLISGVKPPVSLEDFLALQVPEEQEEEEEPEVWVVPDEWKLDPHTLTDHIRATNIKQENWVVDPVTGQKRRA